MDSFQYDRTSSTQQELSVENNKIIQANKKVKKIEEIKEEEFNWDEI